MSLPAAQEESSTRGIAWVVGAGVAGAAVTALALAPDWHRQPARTAVSVLVVGTFVALGTLLAGDRAQRTTGRLFVLAGLFWIVTWLNCWRSGPWPLISWVFGPLTLVFGMWALLRYPHPRLSRPLRALVAVSALESVGGSLLMALTSRPQWHDFHAGAWWPTLWPRSELQDALGAVEDVCGILLSALIPLVLYRRTRQLRGLERAVLRPATLTSSIAPVAWAGTSLAQLLTSGRVADQVIDVVQGLALVAVPMSVLVVLLRRRHFRGLILRLALDVSQSRSGLEVRDTLSRTLGDPELELLFHTPEGLWRSANGVSQLPASRAGREQVPIRDPDGELLGVLDVDRRVTGHPDVLDVVLAIGRLALHTARAQDAEAATRAAGTRLVDAVLAERKRIERLLHDSAQQPLLALNLRLEQLHRRSSDPALAEGLTAAQDLLKTTLADLRALARGMYPTLLAESGLRGALTDLAERVPLAIRVDVPDQRFPADVEAAAYLTASEALANALRHSGADRAVITGECHGERLVLTVSDNGCGVATVTVGGGLQGLEDRLHLLRGRLSVTSRDGVGTELRAEIPLPRTP